MYLTNNDYFCFFIEDPLGTWRKVKKFFKKPKAEFHFFSDIHQNCPYASINWVAKILDIKLDGVMWKDKNEHPDHERDPYVWVCFFRKFGFSINYKVWYFEDGQKRDGGLYYWEYILDYLYYRKDLSVIDVWTDTKGIAVPTPLFSLKGEYVNIPFNCIKQCEKKRRMS